MGDWIRSRLKDAAELERLRAENEQHVKAGTELTRTILELRAENEQLRGDLDAVKYAAHMPEDYTFGLPSWINQRLYVAYLENDMAHSAAARWEERCVRQSKEIERLRGRVETARVTIEGFLSPTSHVRPHEFEAQLRAWLAGADDAPVFSRTLPSATLTADPPRLTKGDVLDDGSVVIDVLYADDADPFAEAREIIDGLIMVSDPEITSDDGILREARAWLVAHPGKDETK
jgi:hypothetical protein